MARKKVGIRKNGGVPQAYVDLIIDGKSTQKTKMFPVGTPDAVLLAWRARTKAEYAPVTTVAGSFAADVATYLAKPEVAAMPYVGQKARHLALWVAALSGDRPRATITRDEVEAVLQMWRTTLADPTVYHRRTALLSLFVKLDGADAANPVRGTTCPKAWNPRDQSVPFDTLIRILAAMPDARYVRKGVRQPATAKIVVTVLCHTGVRGVDLLAVRRPHVNWTAGTVQMPASSKGKGVPTWTLRLTPDAMTAFRVFDAANLYGAFCESAVSHSFKRAVRAVLGPDSPVHLYSLRHSVGADLYRDKGDLATVGRLLGHTPGSRVTAQYACGANEDVDRAAVAALGARRTVAVHDRS